MSEDRELEKAAEGFRNDICKMIRNGGIPADAGTLDIAKIGFRKGATWQKAKLDRAKQKAGEVAGLTLSGMGGAT